MLALGLAAGTAFAQNGNPCPGDKEYQFNIIGVAKGKNPEMTGNSGHRMFVPLTGKTKIFMTGDTDQDSSNGLQCGNNFQMLDANATDGEGTLLVPCDNLTADNLDPDVCYDVWATPLGGPGSANVDVVCSFDDECIGCNIDAGDCGTGNIDFSLVRESGKPVQKDVTRYFRASGCIDLVDDDECGPGDISFNNEWIFNIEQLLEYYWDYDNNGLRLTQVRFCDVEGQDGECGPNVIL
jgi:hypothetical protein